MWHRRDVNLKQNNRKADTDKATGVRKKCVGISAVSVLMKDRKRKKEKTNKQKRIDSTADKAIKSDL